MSLRLCRERRWHHRVLPLIIMWPLLMATANVAAAQDDPPRTIPRKSSPPPAAPTPTVPTEVPTPPPPESYILIRTGATGLTKEGDVEVIAPCQSGEQLLGGGYAISSVNSYSLSVRASHPQNDSWRVLFHDLLYNGKLLNQGVTLTAYAYCFHAPNFPLGMTTVTSDEQTETKAPPMGATPLPSDVEYKTVVECPAGSVLTGGGFRVGDPSYEPDGNLNTDVRISRPQVASTGIATGWLVMLHPELPKYKRPVRSYARCATKNLHSLPAGVLATGLINKDAGAQVYDLTSACSEKGVTTGGGQEYVGDPLIPHPVLSGFSVSALHEWRQIFFGAWQTPNYTFRGCDPATNNCLSGVVVAACFQPPAIPFISVRITSPSDGSQLGLDRSTAPNTRTGPVTFTAAVVDQSGNPLPSARLVWTYSTATQRGGLGTGGTTTGRLPAGGTLTPAKVTVTARYGKLMATDTISVSTGTVP